MPELDLLSGETYREFSLGQLLVRVTPVVAPPHPLGIDYAEPHFGIFASAKEVERGWLSMFAATEENVDEAIDSINNAESLERTERLSILIGASWPAIAASARACASAQETAVMKLPPEIYGYAPDELRRVRKAIPVSDPTIVVMMLGMTYHWQTDEGGYRGARFD